jgi:hypothetical protein
MTAKEQNERWLDQARIDAKAVGVRDQTQAWRL